MIEPKKIRLSDYFCKKIVNKGIDTAFLLTGGGAMHLNDAITRNKNIKSYFLHHEQSLTMAAEGFYRINNKVALVNVTTGPGSINAINGVFGAFVDSIPMLIISGQVKTSTMLQLQNKNLRQLGDQEVNLYHLVRPVVKYIATPITHEEAIIAFKKCMFFLKEGRPGPVWLDIPMDIQSKYLDLEEIERIYSKERIKKINDYTHPNTCINKNISTKNIEERSKLMLKLIESSNRPLILAGNGIRISGTQELFLKVVDNLKIPAVTGWNSHDLLSKDNKYNCGKPSTVGDRSGNYAIKNCDLLIVLGCRLNIRQISYNWKNFAKDAKIIMVDIDKSEMSKHTLNIYKKFHFDLRYFMPKLEKYSRHKKYNQEHVFFLNWCKKVQKKYPIINSKLYKSSNNINPYSFFSHLYKFSNQKDTIVLGNGTACVVGLQCADLKKGTRGFTNSGSASMGYDLPASIGSSIANKKRRIICVTGDGSIMMNLQELATINYKKLPIKIFILNNNGYHSIRQTQKNFFPDNVTGTSKQDGVGFPNFVKIGKAFGIKSISINSEKELINFLNSKLFYNKEPVLIDLNINQKQDFQPKLKSKIDNRGNISTPELHDMWPFLSGKEVADNLIDSKDV